MVKEREMALLKEAKRQERNDELRKTFAQHANTFHSWLTDVRYRSSWMTSIMFVLHNSVLSRHKIQDIYPPPTHTHTHTQDVLDARHWYVGGTAGGSKGKVIGGDC